MQLLPLLEYLHETNVQLDVVDGILRVQAPKGVVDNHISEHIKSNKIEIIRFLERKNSKQNKRQQIPIVTRSKDLPLSFSQQRLWLIDQIEGDSSQYNIPFALKLIGELSTQALSYALSSIVARHEVLRTCYEGGDDDCRQVIQPKIEIIPDVTDLRSLSDTEKKITIKQLADAESCKPFNLSSDLMMRAHLLKNSAVEHVLLITVHHIAADGWSMGILVEEFCALYDAHLNKNECPIPELKVQYADFASWQRSGLRSKQLSKQLSYWLASLDGAPHLINLPLDRPRKKRQNFISESHQCDLDESDSKQLLALARQCDATLFMVLESILALLLARWGGVADVVIGVPIAGRNHIAIEPLIGFFVNTLVLRTRLDMNVSFLELLEQTRAMTLEAYANQDIPFDKIVDEIGVDRSLAYNPLCQVKFDLQAARSSVPTPELTGLEVELLEPGMSQVRFDLDVSATETEHGITINWSYKKELFDHQTIERLAKSFEYLVRQVVSTPGLPLKDLSPLTAAQIESVLSCSAGPTEAVDEIKLHQAFEIQAKKSPDAVAVKSGKYQITYRQLNKKANRIARYINSAGVSPGKNVGIFVERSVEMMVGILGILKSGCAYVPIDPGNTTARCSRIIESAEIDLVLVQPELAVKIELPTANLLLLDGTTDKKLQKFSVDNPKFDSGAADLAYVIFTSGSTGIPKGAVLSHANVMDYLAFAMRHYYSDKLKGSYVITSHGFDITVPSLFLPILCGDCVELAPPGGEIQGLAGRCGKNVGEKFLLRMTPAHVQGLLDCLQESGNFPNEHVFVIGGAVLSPVSATSLQKKFPKAQIYNHYGPTEATVGCSMFDVTANIDSLFDSVPIGRAMSNTRLFVLDDYMSLCPIGVVGQLYISGACVSQGYFNLPEQTRDAFLPCPPGLAPEEIIYRTGDSAKYRRDGNLMYVGRNDDQIKIRGFRIEPGEVEKQLCELEQIHSSLVIATENQLKVQQLVAYVLPTEKWNINEEDQQIESLRFTLETKLPDYMVPTQIIRIDSWPVNSNGKIDKRKLPEPNRRRSKLTYIAPANKREKLLVKIWSELLKLPENTIGTNANFFALGGDSLKVLQLVTSANKNGISLPASLVFEQQTIAGMLRTLDPAEHPERCINVEWPVDRSLIPNYVVNPYPLTSMQELMVREYGSRNKHGSEGVYHLQRVLEFSKRSLNVDYLKAAIQHVYSVNPMLQTRIEVLGDGSYLQWIDSSMTLTIEELYLRGGYLDVEPEVQLEIVADRKRKFLVPNIEPLARFKLLFAENERIYLIHSKHHAIADGWSSTELTNQLLSAYESLSLGKELVCKPRKNVFKELAFQLNDPIQSTGFSSFWDKHLEHIDYVALPKIGNASDSQEHLIFTGPGPNELKTLIEHCGCSVKAVYVTSLALSVHQWSKQKCNACGVVTNGRTEFLSDPLQGVGLFWNMLPIPLELDSTFTKTIKRIHGHLLQTERNCGVSLPELEDKAGHPMFFATLNYADFHNAVDANGVSVDGKLIDGHDKFHYPINIAISPVNKGVTAHIRVDYDRRYFSKASATKFAKLFIWNLRLSTEWGSVH